MENNNLENNNTNQVIPEIVGQSYNQQIMSNAQPQNLSVLLQNAVSEKFSQEDLNKINELSNSIDLKDSVSVMSYGAAAQNKMIQFSENTLSNVMNKDLANRFEKRIHDLELTRTISVQTIPQIRLVQNNNVIMTEKIQSTIANTIPLWKNQMVLAIGLHHSTEAAKAQRAVTDTTNELLRKNADMLKTSTIETAKEAERGIIDIETLKYTNEQLISTLDEVIRIQTEGREKRRAAEAELKNIENELKAKILNISKK